MENVFNISEESIQNLIDERLNIVPGRISKRVDFTHEHLNIIREVVVPWYFDDLAAEWYLSTKNNLDKVDSRILDFFNDDQDIGYQDVIELLKIVEAKCIQLDSEFDDYDDDFGPRTVDYLKKYLLLLTEHQTASARYAINRWSYVGYHKNLGSARSIRESLGRLLFFNNSKKDYYTECENNLDIHEALRYSWQCLSSGLIELSLMFSESLKDYLVELEKKYLDFYEYGGPKPLLVVTPIRDLNDGTHKGNSISRYMLSTNLCIAKAYCKLGRVEEAKTLYKENIKLNKNAYKLCDIFERNSKYSGIDYKCGLIRSLESAIEWFKISDKEEKELSLSVIKKLFRFSKKQKGGSTENCTDSLREVLLISYGLLRDVLNKDKNQ